MHILYGGSFDPPHQAHVACIDRLCQLFPHARLYMVPAYRPLISSGVAKALKLSFAERVQLCKKALNIDPNNIDPNEQCPARSSERQSSLQVLELEREIANACDEQTAISAKALLKAFRETETFTSRHEGRERVAFVIGSDQWESLSRWHDIGQVLTQTDFIVCRRVPARRAQEETHEEPAAVEPSLASPHPVSPDSWFRQPLDHLCQSVGDQWTDLKKEEDGLRLMFKQHPAGTLVRSVQLNQRATQILALDLQLPGVSSSGIWQAHALGKSIPYDWVPRNLIEDYRQLGFSVQDPPA